ncbi:uncharacterized protein LOC123522205 [Echinops telfairi]|uniref:Uncharacterized protein LOC123522205 n=1 Tax=Echinops telfairi TaxID=9371 RepID=A0AC55DFE8_ECHTE|nr:uncharacterized protein LOC123522205 [Echinops telfairi]
MQEASSNGDSNSEASCGLTIQPTGRTIEGPNCDVQRLSFQGDPGCCFCSLYQHHEKKGQAGSQKGRSREHWEASRQRNTGQKDQVQSHHKNRVLHPGYAGLINQGATCYLNSIPKCLFTQELQDAVCRCEDQGESSLITQLCWLFEALEESEAPVSTTAITRCLELRDVHRQEDALLCFRMLLTRMTAEQRELGQLFQMTLMGVTQCQRCETKTGLEGAWLVFLVPVPQGPAGTPCSLSRAPHRSGLTSHTSLPGTMLLPGVPAWCLCCHRQTSREESRPAMAPPEQPQLGLWLLPKGALGPLPVLELPSGPQDKAVEGLFQKEWFTGDKCDHKEDACLTLCLRSLPRVLVIVLQRFTFHEGRLWKQCDPVADKAVEGLFQKEWGTRDNQYFCDECDHKEDACSKHGKNGQPGSQEVSSGEDQEVTRQKIWEKDEVKGHQNARAQHPGYAGLINQGATCYLNSILQCLFFTQELQDAVRRCEDQGESSLVTQLRRLFEALEESQGPVSTTAITRCLGLRDVHRQEDALLCFQMLLTRMTAEQRELGQLFQMTLEQVTQCQGCETKTGLEEARLFLVVPVPQGPAGTPCSLDKAVKGLFQKEWFTGDNQYFCDECDRKEDSCSVSAAGPSHSRTQPG